MVLAVAGSVGVTTVTVESVGGVVVPPSSSSRETDFLQAATHNKANNNNAIRFKTFIDKIYIFTT